MNTFSVEAAFRFGWDTFKKRASFFIGVAVILILASWISGMVLNSIFPRGGFIPGLVNLAISTLIDLGLVATMLKIYDAPESAKLSDLWHPQGYLPFFGVTIMTAIIVVVGLILLIVPGVIAAVTLLFAKFLVVDRKLAPIEALKESARITKGHRTTLLLMILAVVVANLLGLLALVVGLLVSIPVSALAMVYTYRSFNHAASEVTPAASTPVASA